MRAPELGVTIDHYLGSLGIHHYAAGPGVCFASVTEQHGNASLPAEMRGPPSTPVSITPSEGAGKATPGLGLQSYSAHFITGKLVTADRGLLPCSLVLSYVHKMPAFRDSSFWRAQQGFLLYPSTS